MIFNFLRRKNNDNSNDKKDIKKQNSIKISFGSIYDKIKTLGGTTGLSSELREEMKRTLVDADMNVGLVGNILDELEQNLKGKTAEPELIKSELSEILIRILDYKVEEKPQESSPTSIIMIGINGAGKTTTCGKIAFQLQKVGKKVTLAAGDTYRAAAIEQLQAWGERAECKVISQQQGSDSASVIHDGLTAAKANGSDYLIADTSGRLHTQANLMGELKKIKKVMANLDESAPHEIWLVLDASLGQNNIQQAVTFKKEIGLTGIVITKIDGSGKGGSIFSIVKELQIPLKYVGIGEGADDLRPFNSKEFVANIME